MFTYTPEEQYEIENIIASQFIARPDVKAVQNADGTWRPEYSPFTREDIAAHLSGAVTYGHYSLNMRNETKMIVFDIDLDAKGVLPVDMSNDLPTYFTQVAPVEDLRGAWRNWGHPARGFMKFQFKVAASIIAAAAYDHLGLHCAVEYSGSKGLHVCAFLPEGARSGEAAFEAAMLVMEATGRFTPRRGNNYWKDTHTDPVFGLQNITIETFPKQSSISDGGLGNLVALPLGRNRKNPGDPKFFVNLLTPMTDLTPVSMLDAMKLHPWGDQMLMKGIAQ